MAAAQKPEQKPAETADGVETVTRLTVVGPAVVLATTDGSERYLYRGAVVARDGFTEKSIDHAIDNGLVAEVETLVVVESTK